MEQITKERLVPTLPPPPANPTVQEAMQAWMAMARGYASLVVRQHEFEDAVIDVLKQIDRHVEDIDERVSTLVLIRDISGEAPEASTATPPTDEPPTDPR